MKMFLASYCVAWLIWLLGHLALAIASNIFSSGNANAFSFFENFTSLGFAVANALLMVLFVPFVRPWLEQRLTQK
jgi:hypothetical protein